MLSNAYFLAKFRFDTAENEPAKNLQNFRKMQCRNAQDVRLGSTVSTVMSKSRYVVCVDNNQSSTKAFLDALSLSRERDTIEVAASSEMCSSYQLLGVPKKTLSKVASRSNLQRLLLVFSRNLIIFRTS